jgi:hypothetical protein
MGKKNPKQSSDERRKAFLREVKQQITRRKRRERRKSKK